MVTRLLLSAILYSHSIVGTEHVVEKATRAHPLPHTAIRHLPSLLPRPAFFAHPFVLVSERYVRA